MQRPSLLAFLRATRCGSRFGGYSDPHERRQPHPSMPHRIDASELSFTAIRAQGPGGQHVNKASTAVQLRFDIAASSLPAAVKARLLASGDSRIASDGTLVIKAQGSRSLAFNKADALGRLQALVDAACHVPKARRATQPSRGARLRRLEGKAQRAEVKAGRGKPDL